MNWQAWTYFPRKGVFPTCTAQRGRIQVSKSESIRSFGYNGIWASTHVPGEVFTTLLSKSALASALLITLTSSRRVRKGGDLIISATEEYDANWEFFKSGYTKKQYKNHGPHQDTSSILLATLSTQFARALHTGMTDGWHLRPFHGFNDSRSASSEIIRGLQNFSFDVMRIHECTPWEELTYRTRNQLRFLF